MTSWFVYINKNRPNFGSMGTFCIIIENIICFFIINRLLDYFSSIKTCYITSSDHNSYRLNNRFVLMWRHNEIGQFNRPNALYFVNNFKCTKIDRVKPTKKYILACFCIKNSIHCCYLIGWLSFLVLSFYDVINNYDNFSDM